MSALKETGLVALTTASQSEGGNFLSQPLLWDHCPKPVWRQKLPGHPQISLGKEIANPTPRLAAQQPANSFAAVHALTSTYQCLFGARHHAKPHGHYPEQDGQTPFPPGTYILVRMIENKHQQNIYRI